MNNQQFNPLALLMQGIQQGLNPNAIIQNLQQQALNNPQIQPVLREFEVLSNQMKNSGMTPQQFVTQYAKQRGLQIPSFVNGVNQKRY